MMKGRRAEDNACSDFFDSLEVLTLKVTRRSSSQPTRPLQYNTKR